jgi:hypothetical protein
MDLNTLLFIVCIVAYTTYEYKKREKKHRMAITSVRAGLEPLEEMNIPNLRRLFAIGFVGFVCLATAAGFEYTAIRAEATTAGPLHGLAGIFALLLLLVAGMFVRDFRLYREFQRIETEARQ